MADELKARGLSMQDLISTAGQAGAKPGASTTLQERRKAATVEKE